MSEQLPSEQSDIDIEAWKETLGARFISKCLIGDKQSCWEWTASRYTRGYGKFRVGQKWTGAHRISLQATGIDITGWHVLHGCDNPLCVNPHHLRTGDRFDNMQDMAKRRRFRDQTGENSFRAVLTEKAVVELRSRFASIPRFPSGRIKNGELLKLIREFGVSSGCIRHAAYGRNWSHIK